MKGRGASADYLDLARLVLRLSRHLYRTFDEALGPAFGLATKDYLVLRVIQDGTVHPGGVAGYLNMPPASVSRVLERLERKGYLERAVDAEDHRRFRLSVTPEGARTVAAIRDLMGETLSAAYAHVPRGTLRSAVQQLSTLDDAFDGR